MKNKHIHFISSFLTGIALTAFILGGISCKKFLTLTPNDAISTMEAIVDAGTARAAIIGAYDRLQSYYANDYPTLGVMPADNVIFNGTLSEYLQLDQNAIPTDNVKTVSAYQKIYQTINSANSVIAFVPKVTDPALSEKEKNTILGEAYFIRALAYFDLVRGWGGVQLQLEPTKDLSSLNGIKRSSSEETYDQILSDLIKAEPLLTNDGTTRNRAQKSTVWALRARLHLYRQQWQDAADYATKVIDRPEYQLVKPFNTFFTAPFLSPESVFELTFTSNDRNSYWNFWYPSGLGGQYTLKPSKTIIEKLNDPKIGGSRKSLIAGEGNSIYGVLYNTSTSSTDPAYVIRISELHLIRAEAYAHLGSADDLDKALLDLNTVRARADVPASTASTQAEILFAVEEENSVEFPFEAHRWFDLVRTGRAGDVLGITDQRYWLFPLPYQDVLSDPDLDDNNPGY